MLRRIQGALFLTLAAAALSAQAESAPASRPATSRPKYAVVVSEKTLAKKGWNAPVESLVAHYGATVVRFESDIEETKKALTDLAPEYTAFVLRPSELSRDVIARIHRLTRRLDDDPYTDTLWGIVTGRTGTNALAVVSPLPPLVVKNALTTTGVNDGLYDHVFTLSDGVADTWHEKTADGKTITEKDAPTSKPTSMWNLFGDRWDEMAPDMIVSSSHGFQFGIEMPFSRGMFGGFGGRLVVFDMQAPQEARALKPTTNPKIFLPVGNCLVGDLDQKIARDSLILTLQSEGGVRQSLGYTVETWCGRGGWGMWNWFQGNPGVYSAAEAFYFNEQTIIRDLAAKNPKALNWDYDWRPSPADKDPNQKMSAFFEAAAAAGFDANDRELMGLLWDRDTVAFYGDPAWSATLDRAKSKTPWRLDVTTTGDGTLLRVSPEGSSPMASAPTIGVRLPRSTGRTNAPADGARVTLADDFAVLECSAPIAPGKDVVVKITKAAR